MSYVGLGVGVRERVDSGIPRGDGPRAPGPDGGGAGVAPDQVAELIRVISGLRDQILG